MRQFRLGRDSFYYGAVMSCIMANNENLTIDMLHCKGKIRAYRIRTNEGMECIAIFKTGCEKSPGSRNWLCRITEDDRAIFNDCSRLHIPLLQYILCPSTELYDSDIVVLRYDEIKAVMSKKSFTLSIDSSPNAKNGFRLHRVPIRKEIYIPKNRVIRDLSDMIREVIAASNGCLRRRFPNFCIIHGYQLLSLFRDDS